MLNIDSPLNSFPISFLMEQLKNAASCAGNSLCRGNPVHQLVTDSPLYLLPLPTLINYLFCFQKKFPFSFCSLLLNHSNSQFIITRSTASAGIYLLLKANHAYTGGLLFDYLSTFVLLLLGEVFNDYKFVEILARPAKKMYTLIAYGIMTLYIY